MSSPTERALPSSGSAPARVRPISAIALRQMLQTGAAVALFDVRSEEERRTGMIPTARAFERLQDLAGVDPRATLVVYCHHGIRSRAVAERLVLAGFSAVYNLEGGMDAWASTALPSPSEAPPSPRAGHSRNG